MLGLEEPGASSLKPFVATLKRLMELPEVVHKRLAPTEKDGVKLELTTQPYPGALKPIVNKVVAKYGSEGTGR